VGTAKLLALLASDLGQSPESAAEVRRRMQRDPRKQPYQAHRIAGGALKSSGMEVYSKSGTWGPIFADAGIIRSPSGRQLVLVVFTDSQPAYRGDFIADLARACTAGLLDTDGDSRRVKREERSSLSLTSRQRVRPPGENACPLVTRRSSRAKGMSTIS
jgi:hypothetical protein